MALFNPKDFIGWKYERYKDRALFNEWIYMNMIQDDITAILTYGVASNLNPGTVFARVYKEGEVSEIRKLGKPQVLKPSEKDSSIIIDDCSIKVDSSDPDLFYVRGELDEGGNELEWDLEYRRLVPQINSMDFEGVGWFPNHEGISWQVKMPVASVKGRLGFNGREYKMDTRGYVDSNWGQWPLVDVHWNWLHTFGKDKDRPYAIASASIRGNDSCGDLYVRTPGKEVRFFKNKKELEFEHLDWVIDKITGRKRPSVTKLTGRSLEGYEVDLIAKDRTRYTIRPFPNWLSWFVDWDMFESYVDVKGQVRSPSGKVMIDVDSRGFREYDITRWLPFIGNLFGGKK